VDTLTRMPSANPATAPSAIAAPAYDEFDDQRRSMGVSGDAVFQSIEDPNDVTVWHDFDTAEAAKALVSSDELRNAMQGGGVQGEPQVWFVTPS
jgi:hypothetical protein